MQNNNNLDILLYFNTYSTQEWYEPIQHVQNAVFIVTLHVVNVNSLWDVLNQHKLPP